MDHHAFSRSGPALVVLMALVGCFQSGPRLTKVTGTITVAGKPLANGSITFIAEAGGENAAANIAADGRYALSTSRPGSGVKPGSYQVVISAFETPPRMNEPGSGKPAIHSKYFSAKTSGLTAAVHDAGSQVIDFDLVQPEP